MLEGRLSVGAGGVRGLKRRRCRADCVVRRRARHSLLRVVRGRGDAGVWGARSSGTCVRGCSVTAPTPARGWLYFLRGRCACREGFTDSQRRAARGSGGGTRGPWFQRDAPSARPNRVFIGSRSRRGCRAAWVRLAPIYQPHSGSGVVGARTPAQQYAEARRRGRGDGARARAFGRRGSVGCRTCERSGIARDLPRSRHPACQRRSPLRRTGVADAGDRPRPRGFRGE